MLNYLLQMEDQLDEWEVEFVNSLSELPQEQTLTEKQAEKLREIYAKY